MFWYTHFSTLAINVKLEELPSINFEKKIDKILNERKEYVLFLI